VAVTYFTLVLTRIGTLEVLSVSSKEKLEIFHASSLLKRSSKTGGYKSLL
jgi:hypothetical protein